MVDTKSKSFTSDSKQSPVQTSIVIPAGCSLMSRCPIIRNGGIRCQDHLDCKTYDYIMNGTVRID